MLDWPTTSRITLSATSFTVVSGFWMLKRYLLRVLDAPVDHEVDVDDVLVAGQHQALFGDIADAAAAARRSAHADLDDVLARDLRQPHFLDRVGQAEMQARRLLPVDLAEAHDDAELVRVAP